jgi:hypothetical protein
MISAFPAASGTALLRVAIATALTLLMHGAGAQDRPAETKVRLVVGGKSAIFYLPLAVTERLGYFKERGIDAEIADVQSGARALQSLIGGSADVGVGTFDHTIQMQAKGQPVVAVLQYGLYPGFVLGTIASKAITYAGPQSLKGLKIGVTSPGSSTHFMARRALRRGRGGDCLSGAQTVRCVSCECDDRPVQNFGHAVHRQGAVSRRNRSSGWISSINERRSDSDSLARACERNAARRGSPRLRRARHGDRHSDPLHRRQQLP